MNDPKIQLSEEEWQLVSNSGWILTKHGIIDKVYGLFGQLAQQMQGTLEVPGRLPEVVRSFPPKIARGEQYQRLPWVVLDYPRYFSKTEVFAIRNFFWWGHYFSSTLHLKGRFQQALAPQLVKEAAGGMLAGFYWSNTGDEFNFDVHSGHYRPMDEQPPGLAEAQNGDFLKLTVTHPLEEWATAGDRLLEVFHTYIHMYVYVTAG